MPDVVSFVGGFGPGCFFPPTLSRGWSKGARRWRTQLPGIAAKRHVSRSLDAADSGVPAAQSKYHRDSSHCHCAFQAENLF
jgi:hypothetical protein